MKFLCLLFLAAVTTMIVSAKPPADLQARLDAFAKDQPGGVAVAWVDADGTAFFSAGKFSATDARPITADTVFEIGSVSKVFTALLLAESDRLGKVSRSDPAAKYLLPADDPAQPALAKITLLSLTTHTSGLPRLPANIGLNPDANPDPYAAYDHAKLLEGLRLHGPSAPVGQSMAYSNFGVSVLGEALGAAWGTSYTDALQAHVLTPLGLKATSVGLVGSLPPTDLAPAHVQGKVVPNWTWQASAAAGGLRSSARDLSIFLAACLGKNETPLRAAIDASLQPQHTSDAGGHIGLGWMLTDDPARPVAWHNGATAGTHTFVAFCRKTGEGIAILANSQKASEPLGFSLLGAKPSNVELPVVKNAADYVGLYPLSPSFVIAITTANGALFLQATAQPKLALRETAPDRFAVVGVTAEVSFERDAAGKVSALILHQNGRDLRGARGEAFAAPKEITLTPESLRDYAGAYPLTPAFVLTVTEEHGGLFVQATGQSKIPVFASAKNEFFYKVVDARISFQRDATGKVTGLVLHQNGRDQSATKKGN